MWNVFSVSRRLMLTAVMSLLLLVGGLAFFPQGLQVLLNAAKWIVSYLPDQSALPLNDEGARFLYDLVVDDQTIFGLLITLVARILIEILWGLSVLAFGPEKS